jgi:hypothetical protein
LAAVAKARLSDRVTLTVHRGSQMLHLGAELAAQPQQAPSD